MGLVLDAGALIGFEKNDRPTVERIVHWISHSGPVLIPAGVVAQVWRDGRRQARIARLLDPSQSEVVPLDRLAARRVGYLLRRSGLTDVVDASVVLCARETDSLVLTSDPDDLRRLDPKVRLKTV